MGGEIGVRKKVKIGRLRVGDTGQNSPEILKRTRLQTAKEKDENIKYGFPGGGKDPRLDYAKIKRQSIRENLKLLKDPEFRKPHWRKGVTPPPDYPDWFNSAQAEYSPIEQRLRALDPSDDDEADEAYIKIRERGLDDFELNGKKYLAQLDKRISKAALNFFNKTPHSAVDYELVETLGSFAIHACNGLWYHCNFKAKSKKIRPSQPRPSPELFFAELRCIGMGRYTVTSCTKLDASCRLVGGCQVCPKPIKHPFGKFQVGGGEGRKEVGDDVCSG